MFKVNNKNTTMTSIRCSSAFIVNFENISHLFLVFLLLTFNNLMLSGFTVLYITTPQNLIIHSTFTGSGKQVNLF